MSITRSLLLLTLAGLAFGMAGCGLGHEYLVAVQVIPPGGTASVGSTNTVQFKATGWYATVNCGQYGSCYNDKPDKSETLTTATWATSDSVNTSIDASGLATCLSLTPSPATITASASGGLYGSIKGTATLVCN